MRSISTTTAIALFFNNILGFIIFIVFAFIALMQLREISELIENPTIIFLISNEFMIGVVAVILVGGAFWSYLLAASWRYGLTDTELKSEFGVLSKKYSSIAYLRIQNVDIKRSLIERMMNQSTVGIQTSGSARHEIIIPGLSFQEAELLRTEIMEKSKENG